MSHVDFELEPATFETRLPRKNLCGSEIGLFVNWNLNWVLNLYPFMKWNLKYVPNFIFFMVENLRIIRYSICILTLTQALTIKLQPKLIHCCFSESRCLTTNYISIPLPLSILKLKLNLPLNSNLNSNLLSLELDLSLNLNNWIRFYGYSFLKAITVIVIGTFAILSPWFETT